MMNKENKRSLSPLSPLSILSMERDEDEMTSSIKVKRIKKKKREKAVFDSSDYFLGKQLKNKAEDDMIDLDTNMNSDFLFISSKSKKKKHLINHKLKENKEFLLNVIIPKNFGADAKEQLISELLFISKINSEKCSLSYQIIAACSLNQKFNIVYDSSENYIYGDECLSLEKNEEDLPDLLKSISEDFINMGKAIKFIYLKSKEDSHEESYFITETVKANKQSENIDIVDRGDLKGYIKSMLEASNIKELSLKVEKKSSDD